MTTPTHEGLLAPSDIADLAGVSRAAVSNWRKRMTDFPQPAGGSPSKPLFAAADIDSWLSTHPEKRKNSATAESSKRAWESRLWGLANHFRGQVSAHELGGLFLRVAVDILEERPSRVSTNVDQRAIDDLRYALESVPREELPSAIDAFLGRTTRALGKAAGETGFVGSRTSYLLASLAAASNRGTLYDPACGVGVALLQALEMGARPERVLGHEINETAASIARGRAKLHGVDLEVHTADVLLNDPDPALRAGVIIAEPPFGIRVDRSTTMVDPRLRFGIPPRSSADAYWLQHVIAHLEDGGVGYVITSPGLLFRSGAEAKIRRNLLLGGWVRAIVGLPGKMLPQTAIAPVLWVLGQAESPAGDSVLLVDASGAESPERNVARWLADEASLEEVPHARVAFDELAAGNADLSPARWVRIEAVDTAQMTADFECAQSQILEASAHLPAVARALEPPLLTTEPAVMTVTALIEAGAIELASARPPRQGSPEFSDRQVDAAAVRTRSLAPAPDDVDADHGILTLPGDVLLTTVDKIRAVVDEHGGHLAVGSIARIRVLDQSKLDPQYLADVLSGEWNLRLAAGTAIQRIPVREVEVPILSLDDQIAVHRAIDKARQAKQLALQVSEAADTLTTALLNAVRYGVTLTSTDTEGTTR